MATIDPYGAVALVCALLALALNIWQRFDQRRTAAAANSRQVAPPAPATLPVFLPGDRVRIKQGVWCGGMHGTVSYVEPTKTRIWVRRDRASSDVFYLAHELEHA